MAESNPKDIAAKKEAEAIAAKKAAGSAPVVPKK